MSAISSACEAVRVAGGVTALQPGLVDAQPAKSTPLAKETRVGGNAAAIQACVELGHPRANAIGVEDEVPGPLERVGNVDAPAVTADLDHLGPPSRWSGAAGCGCRRTMPLRFTPGLTRLERVRYIALLELTGAPAGDIQPAVVHRQVDVRESAAARRRTAYGSGSSGPAALLAGA